MDETVEINVDCGREVENEVIVVDVVTLVVIEPKQDILSIKKTIFVVTGAQGVTMSLRLAGTKLSTELNLHLSGSDLVMDFKHT